MAREANEAPRTILCDFEPPFASLCQAALVLADGRKLKLSRSREGLRGALRQAGALTLILPSPEPVPDPVPVPVA